MFACRHEQVSPSNITAATALPALSQPVLR